MRKLLSISMAAVTFIAVPLSAHSASLIGSQVTVTADYPTLGTHISVPKTATIGPGVEFPSGSLEAASNFNGSLISADLDVGASYIDEHDTQDGLAVDDIFNGLVYDFSESGPAIIGVSLNPLSTFTDSQIGLSFGPHQVTINEQGLSFTASSRVLVDLTFAPETTAVPEPGTYALLLVGLGLVGFAVCRNPKSW